MFPNPSSFIPILIGSTDGPALTAAAAASCIPTASKIVLPTNYWIPGKQWRIILQGRISCAVTTPGTARFDLRLGSAGSTVVFDTGAINLNTTAKTNVPFQLDINLVCRTVGTGTSSTLFGIGEFQSEALVGSPANTAGGNGTLLVPVGTPAVGSGFDSTAANVVDMFFTQTVATGSMTVHNYSIWEAI